MSNQHGIGAVIPSLLSSLRANVPSRQPPYVRTRSLASPAASRHLPISSNALTKPVGPQQSRPSRPPRSLSTLRLYSMDSHDRNYEGLVLKHQLQESCQSTWGFGFVIYRRTYGHDTSWARFMTIVNERVRESMYFYNAPELMATLDWSVQEDRSVLNNASKEVVRRQFRDWAANATGPNDLFTSRYRYCVQVGHDSLRYVVNDAPQPLAPDLEAIGYGNVICADWRAEEEGDEVEGEEEVEGCRQMDEGGGRWVGAADVQYARGEWWGGRFAT